MNWNATYQYQFATNVADEFSYQGSAGVGLLDSWNINAIPAQYFEAIPPRST